MKIVTLALALLPAVGLGPASTAADAGGASRAALSVRSGPAGASVYVDGRFVGQTPIDLPSVPAGDHRVRVVQDGYLENSRVVRITGGKAETLRVQLTARGQAGQSAQAAGLKIVVIAGEDAVNIIQQKTAVDPVVEVRDRNDLPVSGVPVTFTIAGQNAAFGSGLQTVTVTTNAAGRAAVTSLNPVGSGAVQINVSATYQGQAATATITQTNFATVAAAAQAGAVAGAAAAGATAAGAGAAAGGGLSGLAIAGIAVGAGVGAAVGVKAAAGGGSRAARCTFNVSPTSLSVSPAGGTTSFEVFESASDCEEGKDWTATSHASFITFGGSTSASGSGQMRIDATVQSNAAGDPQRTGTLTIAGQTVTVTQRAGCAFTVSPTSLSFPAAGGTATVTVTMTPDTCEDPTWRANAAGAPFATLNPESGSGSGTVTVTLPPNTAFAGRTGAFSLAGYIIRWVQAGLNAAACLAQRVQGADVPQTRTIQLGSSSGRLIFRYDNGANNPDRMLVTYEGRTLFDTGCAGTVGVRTQPLSYSGNSTTVTVHVTPNCRGGSGSTWSFELSCSQ